MTFIIKDLFLICTENGIELSPILIFSVIAALILFIVFIIFFFVKNRSIKGNPFFIPLGRTGHVTEILEVLHEGSPLFHIKVAGEIWQAKSISNENLHLNDEVEIISQEKNLLILNIRKRGHQ